MPIVRDYERERIEAFILPEGLVERMERHPLECLEDYDAFLAWEIDTRWRNYWQYLQQLCLQALEDQSDGA